jgi:hypothetical protein
VYAWKIVAKERANFHTDPANCFNVACQVSLVQPALQRQ